MGPYPDWQQGVTPHTDSRATVRDRRAVHHRRVLRVRGASYRSAPLSEIFELEEQAGDPLRVTPKGKTYARVVCAWHGVTPLTAYPGLDLSNAEYEVVENFTGQVADNIA